MKCHEIEYGTFNCAYNIMLPWMNKFVSIDKCLIHEVISLWEKDIKTTGCCCGHGCPDQAFIGVEPKFIPQMKSIGYEVYYNNCRPGDEDSFKPITIFDIPDDHINKGFNWWDDEITRRKHSLE